MKKRRLLIVCFVVIAVFTVLITTGCKGLQGPSVYLVDDNGARYYSGSSIFLGEVQDTGGLQFLTENFYLVNGTGLDITISGAPDITLIIETRSVSTGSTSYNTTPPNNPMTLDYSLLQATLAKDSDSSAIVIGLDATVGAGALMIKRRYLIEMTDGAEDYDFVFEVYGYVLDSGGSW